VHGADRRGSERFQGEIPIGYAVEGVCGGAVEAQGLGGHVPVDGKRRTCERRRAERAFVHAGARVGETAAVTPEHLHVGEQVMAEGDGLGRLQVGEARHDGVGMRLGLARKRSLEGGECGLEGIERVAHVHAKVERNLVVARAARVQAAAGRANDLGQPALDVEVNVLELFGEGEAPGLDLCLNLVQAAHDLPGIGLGDDALLREHGGMRL
jgi:hypothetical protein